MTVMSMGTPPPILRRGGAALSICAAAILLSGCNSSTSTPPATSFDAAEARRLTQSNAPEETAAEQEAREAGIVARTDFLTASTFYGETDNPNVPSFALTSSCSRTACRFTDPQNGIISVTISLADLLQIEATTDSERTVLTKNGITLAEFRGGTNGRNYRNYGAWMDHGGFSIETGGEATDSDGVTLQGRIASAGGDRTRSRPTADATWRGVMVGTPARGGNRDNILQGDARLVYSMAGQDIDATFSNIVNLDRQASHSVTTVRFDGVPVGTDGTYGGGGVGNRIHGAFFGPNHEETGGVFEASGIVGAYGAKRQQAN